MKLLPTCIGHYDRVDPACNGEGSSSYEQDKEPCVFRDRCAAFQRQMRHDGSLASDYVTLVELRVGGQNKLFQTAKDQNEFDQSLVRWTKEWNVVNGKVGNAKPIDRRPNRIGGRKRPRAIEVHPRAVNWRKRVSTNARHRREARERDYRIVEWFVKCLTDEIHLHLNDKMAGTPYGGLYLDDKLSANGSVILYVRNRNRPVPIAKLRPNGATIDNSVLALPVLPATLTPLLGSSRLHVFDGIDGIYSSKLMNLDRNGIAWGAIIVARLLKSGTIKVFR